ncbi:MAG: YhfC family glutamic-type intramembrane protease [Anaerolineales bacterium]|nr:YhfC family glutamic-type intramembrane protease [Anaerolineales bacterium]
MISIAYTLSVLGMLLLPIILAVILRRHYRVYWILFVVGTLTFLGSQAVHLPLNNWLADIGLLPESPQLSGAPLWRMALILGLTAGICEELARAIGYTIVKWARRFEDGVMLGLGHAGIEAMLFGGVLTAATISSLISLQGVDLEALNLTTAQLEAIFLQTEQFNSSPLYALAPFIERMLAITAQVTLSMIVLQAFKRRKPLLILVAIGYHALIDAVAVYVAISTNQVWTTWIAFLILLIPGWIWLLRLWRERNSEIAALNEDVPISPALRTTLGLFLANLRKEMLYQWRTWRVLIVCAVLLAFGIISPLLTKFTPQLLSSLEGAEMFAELIPEMTVTDSLNSHIETITQFGFILVILVGMGAVAGEKERGTASIVLSKPLSRGVFLNSKYLSQALLYLLAFIIATAAGYYYTITLFGHLDFGIFLSINGLLLLWILVMASVTLLGSTLGNSTGAAAGFSLAGAVLLLIAGSIPRIGALLPGGLLAWAGQLGTQSEITNNWGAVVMSIVIITICLISALGVFERQELQ